jgi:dTDP-4-amino-4,6-dideoxygalactose transaminase
MAEIALVDPDIGPAEIEAVTRVMRSGWVSIGAETAAFEADFAAALGVDEAVAVSSGTAALHLACAALGLGPGDEVVVPSLTFVATASAVRMTGAQPVFADVAGPTDLSVDPASVAAAITPRTRAVIAVHYGGWPADLVTLRAVTNAAGITLIEDAAHAPVLATPAGMAGTVGDIGCFSFHATKNLTTGEGGMVVARDPALLASVRALRSHAFTPSGDIDRVGFNYRPTDLTSAIGRVQLTRLAEDRALRRRRTAEYHGLLGPVAAAPVHPPGSLSAHHLLPILLPEPVDRSVVQAALQSCAIQTRVHYPPIHRYSAYRPPAGQPSPQLPRTDSLAPRLLTLPLHRRMTTGDVEVVVAALAGALADQHVGVGHAG